MRFNPKVTALVAVALLGFGTTGADAQAWPARPVRIIVPFAPGGTADTLGRLVAQRLGESFKENFVVENRAGAGGVIGSGPAAEDRPPRDTPGRAGGGLSPRPPPQNSKRTRHT